jgi:hypothetical protein
MTWQTPREFFRELVWLDGRPLLEVIEPYRLYILMEFLNRRDGQRLKYNLGLMGRAKKNWKSADLILSALYALLANDSPSGNQVYLIANDLDQAADDLTLLKKIIEANPEDLAERLEVQRDVVSREDGRGFVQILPAQDIKGSHGKTYRLACFDEIHGHKTWDLLEALQLDPTRPDTQMMITSYASLHHRPGVPLHDLMLAGKAGKDPRMYFSWYGADYTTDPAFSEMLPEQRANPSSLTDKSWDPAYLAQQQLRLPSHMFRRLHLNLPGLPEGSAYSIEMIDDAIVRHVKSCPAVPGIRYYAFVDHSHGSADDATLAIAHGEADHRVSVDLVVNQGPPPPFSMIPVIGKFAQIAKEYGIHSVMGDAVGAETYRQEWTKAGINYVVCPATTSELYEQMQPALNAHRVALLDLPILEQQLLGLCWKGQKITHPGGEHDDWATSTAGVVWTIVQKSKSFTPLTWAQHHNTTTRIVKKPTDMPLTPIDQPGGGLVVNPRTGEIEHYRDARGDEPRTARVAIVHDVQSNAHRSECRACRAQWKRSPSP